MNLKVTFNVHLNFIMPSFDLKSQNISLIA